MNCPRRNLLVVGTLLLGVFASACGGGHKPPALPQPSSPSRPSNVSVSGKAIVETALKLQGIPYKAAGGNQAGFDCSGLVQYVFAEHGITLPRNVIDQYDVGKSISRKSLAAGDLVFFATTSKGPSHVGIFVKDGWMIHAPNGRGVVRLERMTGDYWTKRYLGARRVENVKP